jgi:hypothetical protein
MAQSISQEAIGATGLPGATAASRHAGATVSGAPTTGTFAVGDFIVDQSGKFWVCTTAGTPGTWGSVGGSSALTYLETFITADVSFLASTFKNITSLSLTSGTWQVTFLANVTNPTATTNTIALSANPASATSNSSNYFNQYFQLYNSDNKSTSFTKVITLASTTTIYFVGWVSSTSVSVSAATGFGAPNNIATGISAVKIA